MDYLELCQATARESREISGNRPTSVANQTGDLLRLVGWVADSWVRIQNLHPSWRFLRTELPSTALTVSSTQRYTATSWDIDSWSAWLAEKHNLTIYDTSIGVADEGEIEFVDWAAFRIMYVRGTQDNLRPTHWTISPAGEICFGRIPDMEYRVNGEYRRAPQVLSENDDTPIIASQHHQLIVWDATMLMIEHGEADPQLRGTLSVKRDMALAALRREQLPQPDANSGGTLA